MTFGRLRADRRPRSYVSTEMHYPRAMRAHLFSLGLALTAAFVMVPLAPSTGLACSCMAMDHAMAVSAHDVSFRGRATAITREGEDELVTFRIITPFRGIEPRTRTITIRRYAELSMCPVPSFEVGRTYRVYAKTSPEGLRVHVCNPSGR